jgi:hexosaminidase
LMQEKYRRSDASDSMFWTDPWSVDGQRAAPLMRPLLSEIRIHAERAMVLVREAKENPRVDERQALDAMELGARRMDLMAYKFQLSDEIATAYQSALNAEARGEAGRREAASALQSLDSTNGKLQDLRDGYTECKEMYQRAWNDSYRPYWLGNNLVQYDIAIELWVSRIDKMRSAQRQLMYDHSLPSAADLGIPAPPPAGGH